MKHYYKARWEWFCEAGQCYWRAPGGNNTGAIDLRSNTEAGKQGGTPEGFGVFAYAEPQTIPGAEYLGTDKATVANLVWTKLTDEADPTGKTAPKPLTGIVGRDVSLFIAGEKIKSEPFTQAHRKRTVDVFQNDYRENVGRYPKGLLQKWVGAKMKEIYGEMSDEKAELLVPQEHKSGKLWKRPATTISDAFSDTDGTALESHSAAGFSWSKVTGNGMMVQSNKAQRNSTTGDGDRDYRAESDLSTDDMYAKATVGSLSSGFDCAVSVRFSSSARTHYQTEWGTNFRRISKFVSGSHTVITSDGSSNSAGDVLECRANGSTIQAFRNGSQVLTDQTDTSITGNLRAGLSIYNGNSTWDTWEAGDLAAGSSSVSPSVSPSSSNSPSLSPSSSRSPSSSVSPSTSPSSSKSPSLSPSASQSPSPSVGSSSVSPSSSISPSRSPSSSQSPSLSPSSSQSPSRSPSSSLSPSSSKSPSQSPSSSQSPSRSPSTSVSPSQSPSISPSASVSPSVAALSEKKEVLYKIYESDGTFITTWADVVSDITYKWIINGSLSNITVRLARPENSFGENQDVKQGNLLEVYIFDEESGVNGVLVYSGILVSYIPAVQGGKEYIDVEFFPHYWNLKNVILEDSGDTEVAYASQDPGAIMRDILDKYAGTTDYITGSVDNTSTTVSYTYNTNDCQYAVQKVLELCPDGWFFRVGADNIMYMEAREANPTHYFTIGREIIEYYPEKRSEGIINTVYFRGGSTLYKKYTNSSSVSAYGTRAITVIDERVTVEATADIIADRILDSKSSPEIRVVLKIMDSNGEGNEKGYDIESIKPGQTCKILNATSKSENLWDVDLWDGASWDYDITNAAASQLQIMSVEYHLDYAVIELSNRQPDIAKRIEDINRNQVDSITVDNPTAPTT